MKTYIQLDNISLEYPIGKGLKINELLSKSRQVNKGINLNAHTVKALDSINIALNEGDRLGIIGKNGAGKSSLLKTISGIYPPTNGRISVHGTIASLFEFATGFEMESTGYENIIIRGVMLGETPKNMKKKLTEIAQFSELGEYLNLPVKTYSTGMFIRLAFSISTSILPEILLLDEVMAAGDAGFIKKAELRMNDLIDNVKILVFVSHSMESIINFCNKVIWLEDGRIKASGNAKEITSAYINSFSNKISD